MPRGSATLRVRACLALCGSAVACAHGAERGAFATYDGGARGVSPEEAGVTRVPTVMVSLPACPSTSEVLLPANTDPTSAVDIQLSGPCTRFCSLDPTIPCNDAGHTWSTSTLCTCLGWDASWSCASDYPMTEGYCGTTTYACPSEPLLYPGADGGARVLPSGRCTAGVDGCEIRTRQQCNDGSTGVTTVYACSCPETDAGVGEWICKSGWATAVGCNGSQIASASDAGTDAGAFWIEVRGDGAPYVMTSGLMFTNYAGCSIDANLKGCFVAASTPPCISIDVTPPDGGRYIDRNGDYWKVTSVSIEPVLEGGAIGGASADGTLVATAVRADGADAGTLTLTFTFHTPYQSYIC